MQRLWTYSKGLGLLVGGLSLALVLVPQHILQPGWDWIRYVLTGFGVDNVVTYETLTSYAGRSLATFLALVVGNAW